MRIQTNIESLNAYRNLNTTNRALSRSLERLSSGFRINRAADDAAGMAISEKMRSQIGGLSQAVRNAQDGISLIQTAEGALNETHTILQRIRELANQSASDTYTDNDRAEIQKEVDLLVQEITRIGETTEFNTRKLLDGAFTGVLHIGANQGQSIDVEIGNMRADALGIAGAEGIGFDVSGTLAAVDETADQYSFADDGEYTITKLDTVIEGVSSDEIDVQYVLLNESTGDVVAVSADGQTYTSVYGTGGAEVALTELDGDTDTGGEYDLGDVITSGTVTVSIDDSGSPYEVTLSFEGTAQVDFAGDEFLASGTYTVVDENHNLVGTGEYGLLDSQGDLVAYSTDAEAWETMAGEALFTVGNALSAGDEITVSGEGGVDISSREAADASLGLLDSAIDVVSTQRSMLGALQNRLDHTITNLEVSSENLTAAESRIRDVDMAAEMMEFTKNQILTQAGVAMLAQANMAPQAVLQLLG